MSPHTDAYWVGAFAMAAARALHWIKAGRPEKAEAELSSVLARFAECPVLDEDLKQELAPYWEPGKGGNVDNNPL